MTLATAKPFAVAAWPLTEASGTRADSVGSTDLTDINTVGSGTGKVNATCADFEESADERLEAVDNAAISSGDVKFLVRAWVQLESNNLQNYGTIVGKANAAGSVTEYHLIYRLQGINVFEFRYGATVVRATNFGAASTGTWYLIHAWHDPDNNQIAISVNAGTPNTTALSGGNTDTTAGFSIGSLGEYHDSLSGWDGLIDDVVILKGYLLDSTERTEDYNGGTGVAFADWAGGSSGDSVIGHAMQGLESGFIFGSANIAGAGLHNIEAGIVG